MALNELGDVHAHFGNWKDAATAWSDALDTLLGPYQVLKSWRRTLAGGLGMRELLAAYGVHGLLMAGAILCGKLARSVPCWLVAAPRALRRRATPPTASLRPAGRAPRHFKPIT